MMKPALGFAIFTVVLRLASSQDTLSCDTDNLSCPRSDPDSESLQCITTSELCDGTNLCSGGQDEGENLSTLDCKTLKLLQHRSTYPKCLLFTPSVSGTAEVFVCTTGETVALSTLCDGNADCSNGNDETSPICESKKMKCNYMIYYAI